MSKDEILQRLREEGYRITNQRRLIIETILANDCSCCKEIYYQVHKKDPDIGVATVYRMVKTLEEIGVVEQKIVLKPFCEDDGDCRKNCIFKDFEK